MGGPVIQTSADVIKRLETVTSSLEEMTATVKEMKTVDRHEGQLEKIEKVVRNTEFSEVRASVSKTASGVHGVTRG